ncbi:MAG: hypothetical protein LBD08_01515 [Treponema sp.]|jgi:flagellar motor component MotA|nr:hypothetical protein [Treponema sp.]
MNESDFIEEYNVIFERALIFSILSRSMGLVSLHDALDKVKYNQRDIFEYGMRMAIDGRTSELIGKVLTNIIHLETDKDREVISPMSAWPSVFGPGLLSNRLCSLIAWASLGVHAS